MKLKNILIVWAVALAAVSFRAFSDQTTNAAPVAPAAKAKPTPYPFKTCIISGETLGGDMGEPIVFIYTNNGANQEIKFCCPMCQPKFLKDPDKYMKKIKAAEAAQAAAKTK
jgi:hypothetical protein